jgi:hypothetical protein
MQAVFELQSAVSQLSAEELARFREWFDEFDAEAWDQQFEEDVATRRKFLDSSLSRESSGGQ